MGELQEEINFFLEDKERKEEEKKASEDTSNPFLSLIGYYNDKQKLGDKDVKKDKVEKPLVKDDWIEKTHLRPLAEGTAVEIAFDLFDTYKGAHDMASYT